MDAKTLVESIVTGDEEAGQHFTANMSSRIAERLEVLKVAAASQMMGEEVEQIDELTAGKGSAMRNVAAARLKQARAIRRAVPEKIDAGWRRQGRVGSRATHDGSNPHFTAYRTLIKKSRQAKATDLARQKDARVNAPLDNLSPSVKRTLNVKRQFTPSKFGPNL